MNPITKLWSAITDVAVDPDSPIDQALMTGLRDNLIYLREWLGASFTAGAVQNHNHDGINSAPIAGAVGQTQAWHGIRLPSGDGGVWDWCDGGTLLRASYPALKDILMSEATVTLTIASPCVVTWPSHGLRTNLPIRLFTTGALPTGVTAGTHGAAGVGTEYYVKVINADTFNIAATPGGANINTSGVQSGVHTGTVAPCGDGDGSTTFHKPDKRGRVGVGRDDMGGTAANRITSGGSGILGNVLGRSGGAETVSLSGGHNGPHTHNLQFADTATANGRPNDGDAGSEADGLNPATSSSGSGTPHPNTQPSIIEDWIIRIA